MAMDELYAVIMAGGRGTRFWPASVAERPKQFMDLLGGGTMLQLTAGRFRGLTGNGGVLVVTGARHESTVLSQLPMLPGENLLLEPMGRNTAACIGWAAETLRRRGLGGKVMAVAASDHMIEPLEGFESTMRKAAELAEKGYLCTIGIPPDHPATGYGYIRRGAPVHPGWKVMDFKEKPTEERRRSTWPPGNTSELRDVPLEGGCFPRRTFTSHARPFPVHTVHAGHNPAGSRHLPGARGHFCGLRCNGEDRQGGNGPGGVLLERQ